MIVLTVEGTNLQQLNHEAGGHRIQRVPPTERNGRVHTSTVTVAIMDPQQATNEIYLKRNDSDFNIEWYSGSGSGGQHRNKHMNSCRLTHIPTGTVRTAQTRTRQSSYKNAMDSLTEHLKQLYSGERRKVFDVIRKDQMGSGMRGDKIRTYRFRDDQVEDHETGKGATCKKVMSGHFDLLWN